MEGLVGPDPSVGTKVNAGIESMNSILGRPRSEAGTPGNRVGGRNLPPLRKSLDPYFIPRDLLSPLRQCIQDLPDD